PRADGICLRGRNQPAPGQHAGVGLACPDIFPVQPPVKGDGRVKRLRLGRRRLGEPPAPQLAGRGTALARLVSFHHAPRASTAVGGASPAIFCPRRACTLMGRPNRLMKPAASAWLYTASAPKVASSSL